LCFLLELPEVGVLDLEECLPPDFLRDLCGVLLAFLAVSREAGRLRFASPEGERKESRLA
jgi:hypothetical protein